MRFARRALVELVGAVGGPHQPLRAVGVAETAHHRCKVVVGGLLRAEGIEGRQLHVHFRIVGKLQEPLHVGLGLGALEPSLHSQPGEVVDDDRCLGSPRHLRGDRRQGVGVGEEAHGEVFIGSALPHRLHAGRIGPRLCILPVGIKPEAADAALFQGPHLGGDARLVVIDDSHAGKGRRVAVDAIEHVGIVEAVEAHLDEDHARDAARSAGGQKLLSGEARRLHVSLRELCCDRPGGGVGGPDMDVGVDEVDEVIVGGDSRRRAWPRQSGPHAGGGRCQKSTS